jgi:hypothetical protein
MFGRTRQLGLGLGQPRVAGKSSRRRPPFADLEALTHRRVSLRTGIVSAILHVVVIALLTFSTRADRSPAEDRKQQSSVPVAVTMLYVPPKPAPSRPKPHRPEPAPAPAPAAFPKAPESSLPAPTTVAKAPEHDDPAAMSPERKPASRAGDPEPGARQQHEPLDDRAVHHPEDLMVSEARRLFGPKIGAAGGPLGGPIQAGRPVAMVGGGSRCAWEATDVASQPDGPANGVVEGVVRTERGGLPVPGAFLQLLGSGSATFSDDAGHYRLTFDPSLVDRCHSQIVRVTAPGYRARTMVLAYGTWSDNVVDMRGR